MPQFKYRASGTYVIASQGTGTGEAGYQVSVTPRESWSGSLVFKQNTAPPGSTPVYTDVAYQNATTAAEVAAGTAITGTAAIIISPTVGDLVVVVTMTAGEIIINVNPATVGVTNRELMNAFLAAGYDTAGQDTTESMLSVAVAGLLGEQINVKAFGAVGDGVTDDTAAIQAAIDAAAGAGGGVVYLPPGGYRIESSLVLSTNVAFVGSGRGATQLLGAANNLILLDTNQSAVVNNNILVADLSISGFAGFTGMIGIRLTKASFFTGRSIYSTGLSWVVQSEQTSGFSRISDLIMYQGQNGLKFSRSSNFVVMNSTLSSEYTNNTYTGVEIDSYCDGVELVSCNIEGSRYGVHTRNTAGGSNYPLSTILTNVQSGANPATTSGIGFFFEAGSGIQMTGCVGLSASGNGIWVTTDLGVAMTNTNCVNNGFYGLLISANNVQVSGGVFAGNGTTTSNTFSGIGITSNSLNVTVQGVTAGAFGEWPDTQKYGIEVEAGCTGLRVTDVRYGLNGTGNSVFLSVPNATTIQGTLASVYAGAGTPESNVAAAIGSLYLRTDGGAATSLYVKETGTGNTGWVGK